jgi:hypothetical protein
MERLVLMFASLVEAAATALRVELVTEPLAPDVVSAVFVTVAVLEFAGHAVGVVRLAVACPPRVEVPNATSTPGHALAHS